MAGNGSSQQSSNDKGSTWSALSLAWELGYTIAVPIVVFALLGRLLDRRLGTTPWLLLIGIFVSIVVSSVSVYFKTMKIIGRSR
ncbi:MAG: hypothetical protein UX17_C0012G0015 [Parcubacteria group bacterium GW2011_GWC2_45_7]|nr:MAG: hypothetical protein UX17_C0012G0015 [Parcubacteria group bacterium GW2011_GWC2_45_7]KKU73719.1 MAG: hypothetical protein UX98_C0005G0095 [Parcubacteria group bacterium GW2011_GWA2_47_26]